MFFFQKKSLHSVKNISLEVMIFFSFLQRKMIYLSPPQENMNLIREPCDIVGTLAVTTFIGNHGLILSVLPRMNSGLQRPNERLAATHCLLVMGWGGGSLACAI